MCFGSLYLVLCVWFDVCLRLCCVDYVCFVIGFIDLCVCGSMCLVISFVINYGWFYVCGSTSLVLCVLVLCCLILWLARWLWFYDV